MNEYDIIIIGAGTAGQTAAKDLVAEGYSVAVVEESDTPGGICALHGCQAKKWFYEVAEIVARCRHLHHIGITAQPKVSWREILREKDKFTAKIPENTVKNLSGNGVAYLQGRATFVDGSTIDVDGTTYAFRYAVIATGAKPMELPIKGAEYLLTSNDFLALPDIPGRIAFIGGGFISFEFAHFAVRLGGRPGDIHILEAQERPLGPFDSEMVEQLVEVSEVEGIRVHSGVEIVAIKKSGSGFRIDFAAAKSIEVDMVVNGTGRVANIDALNLEAAAVGFGRRGIAVDDHMRTSNERIFAVGDCVQSLQLARVADMEAHVAAKTIIAGEAEQQSAGIDYRAVPAVLFTYPQLGMVGKTEDQLKAEEVSYWKSHDTNLRWPTYRRVGLKHAAYKILVDKENHILGAHFLGDNTTGLVNTFKQAMLDRVTAAELHHSNIISPYPSRESDCIYMLSPFLD